MRKLYLSRIERVSRGLPRPQPQKSSRDPPRKPSFHVYSIQRCPKIEDENENNSGACDSEASSGLTYTCNSSGSPTVPHYRKSYFSIHTCYSNPSPCSYRCDSRNSIPSCDGLSPRLPTPRSPVETIQIEPSSPLHEELAADPRWQAAYYGSDFGGTVPMLCSRSPTPDSLYVSPE